MMMRTVRGWQRSEESWWGGRGEGEGIVVMGIGGGGSLIWRICRVNVVEVEDEGLGDRR